MLSYRKSQQASLTEKLKKKNVIHVLGVSGSGTTMARLCHSAFVRVATKTRGCGVVVMLLCHSAFVRVATTRAASRTCNKALAHGIRGGFDGS